MYSSLFWVGAGGALGAISRVLLMRILPQFVYHIPLQILLINIIGCFLIGFLAELLLVYGPVSLSMRHFLVQGWLGAFTTFSAFALEFGVLYEKGAIGTAIVYAVLSVVLSIAFFFLGVKLIRLAL